MLRKCAQLRVDNRKYGHHKERGSHTLILLNIQLAMLTPSLSPTVPVDPLSWEAGDHRSQERGNEKVPFVLERICHNRYHSKINKGRAE